GTVTDSAGRSPSPTPLEPLPPLPEDPCLRRARVRETTQKGPVTNGDSAQRPQRPPSAARRRLAALPETPRWVWVGRPASLAEAWRQSGIVDPARMPRRRPWWLPLLWRASNCTDRLVLFAALLIAPSVVQGPLRWIVARPTRRL